MKALAKRLIYTLLLLTLSTGSLYAQKRVASAVKSAESHNTTQYCAYSERRDPTTHRLQRSSKVLVISPKDATTVRQAMDADRNKAAAVEIADAGRVYSVTFVKDNLYSVYTLVQQRNNTWLLTVEEYSTARQSRR